MRIIIIIIIIIQKLTGEHFNCKIISIFWMNQLREPMTFFLSVNKYGFDNRTKDTSVITSLGSQ